MANKRHLAKLEQGKEAWNQWRADNPTVKPDLRGANLRGKHLEGFDFSFADIRGTNFKQAHLEGANFTKATAGLQKLWKILLVIVSLFFSLIAGVFSLWIAILIALVADPSNTINFVAGIVSLIVLVVFLFYTLRKGFVAVAVAVALLGAYLGWRSFKGDRRDPGIRSVGVAFGTMGGTSFYDAELSDADFTRATLKNTNLRAKSLTHTCWSSAKKLDLARLGNTILSQANVRELLITRNGYKKSYQDANLRGANLAGVNLEQANLKYANLSEATLTSANLKDVNLTEVQAVGTDFTTAYLTGACLESWNIDHTTKLDKVDCQYIFLLENPNELGSRERRPHDPERVFQPGDFTKLYQEVINTVEILLRKGANPEAFRQAFQQLMADNPHINSDSIKGIERKGEDVLLTLEVPVDTDKAEVEHNFLETYEARLEAAKEQARLEGKSEQQQEQIKDLKEIAMVLAQKESDNIFLAHQEHMEKKTVKESNQSRNINIENSTVNASGAGSFNQGDIQGTVANNINQRTASTDYSKLNLQQLLTKLTKAIENDANFPSEDKQDSLDAIDNLTTASQEKDIVIQKKKANKALRSLERIAKLLPAGAAFITIFKEIAPHIYSLLRL